MIALTLDNSDKFVKKMQRKGIDVRWDGWDMVFFQAHPAALSSVNGRYRAGTYGFETVVSPNEAGKWLVNHKLTRDRNAGR